MYSRLWPLSVSPRCQCVYTMAGQTPGRQQNWRSSEKSKNFKEKTQYLMNTLYIWLRLDRMKVNMVIYMLTCYFTYGCYVSELIWLWWYFRLKENLRSNWYADKNKQCRTRILKNIYIYIIDASLTLLGGSSFQGHFLANCLLH